MLARTVNVPVAEVLTAPLVVVATVKGTEMMEPGSTLVVLAWACEVKGKVGGKDVRDTSNIMNIISYREKMLKQA